MTTTQTTALAKIAKPAPTTYVYLVHNIDNPEESYVVANLDAAVRVAERVTGQAGRMIVHNDVIEVRTRGSESVGEGFYLVVKCPVLAE